MNISVCMIVKNEATDLERCLQSVCNYVSEIIVIDTGSTDGTKEIAYRFTDKVHDFCWQDDFSAARNYSLRQATNDWVLVLDADEVIAAFDSDQIQNTIKQNANSVGRIKRVNCTEGATGERRFVERINRLFNRNYFRYEGIIHEQVVGIYGLDFPTTPVEITVEHIGYTQEVLERTDKITRNIQLLEVALKQDPKDPYLLYQLGQSYYLLKDYQRAVGYFEEALDLPLNFALEYVGNLVETYGYALINTGRYSEALSLSQYAQYYSGLADYLFLMGHIFMNNGMISQAIEHFKCCLSKKECKVEGVNSVFPNYNMGVIYECLGEIERAKKYYIKCGQYPLALNRLKLINTDQL